MLSPLVSCPRNKQVFRCDQNEPAANRIVVKSVLIWALSLSCGISFGQTQPNDTGFKVSTMAPSIIYPQPLSNDAKFSLFTVLSDQLRNQQASSVQIFLNQMQVTPIPEVPPEHPLPHKIYAAKSTASEQMQLWVPWPDYAGKVQLQLNISGQLSEVNTVLISGVQSKWSPVAFAALISLIILALPVGLIKFSRMTYAVDSKPYGVLSALFLDKETDTYSLSKFQFYAWTTAGIFGYLVLTLAQSLVQGKFVFADIPKNLPGIIFISATTTAVAQGITLARGAKGAGPIQPSVADFVTTGGLVAAERFQFFVWTLVGVFTFLFLVVFSDPASITDLPTIPDGFLAMMGVSSFGYLGGKLTRKPGPIIDEIIATLGSLTLQINGRKLATHACFNIDGTVLTSAQVTASGTDPEEAHPQELFKTLTLVIAAPFPKWQLPGRHEFTITNPDGQNAEWFYRLGIETKN
jgi:hypothetical protein